MNNQQGIVNETPSQEQITQFWSKIIKSEEIYNEKEAWIDQERKNYKKIKPDQWRKFTVGEIADVIKCTHNWKFAGPDKLHNFWLKQLTDIKEEVTPEEQENIDEAWVWLG